MKQYVRKRLFNRLTCFYFFNHNVVKGPYARLFILLKSFTLIKAVRSDNVNIPSNFDFQRLGVFTDFKFDRYISVMVEHLLINRVDGCLSSFTDVNLCRFFFYKQHQAEIGSYAKAKQHPEAELLTNMSKKQIRLYQ